jgi:hypothetical protein
MELELNLLIISPLSAAFYHVNCENKANSAQLELALGLSLEKVVLRKFPQNFWHFCTQCNFCPLIFSSRFRGFLLFKKKSECYVMAVWLKDWLIYIARSGEASASKNLTYMKFNFYQKWKLRFLSGGHPPSYFFFWFFTIPHIHHV